MVAALLLIGAGLSLSRATGWVLAGLILCMLTWWLGQDFGVLGTLPTDPNTALPLALLLMCALPGWPVTSPAEPSGHTGAFREPVAAGTAVLGIGSLVVAPLVGGRNPARPRWLVRSRG